MLEMSTIGVDVVGAPPIAPTDEPIDLAHLTRMTLGDLSLEHEVLRLFDRQAAMLMARMQGAEPRLVAASAHTIKGSARGVGAWRIARDAETVEIAAACAGAAELNVAMVRLTASVDEVKAAIAHRLRAFDR
jgi:HPt (histidine-containing phosphotransfer) domain-containing protein